MQIKVFGCKIFCFFPVFLSGKNFLASRWRFVKSNVKINGWDDGRMRRKRGCFSVGANANKRDLVDSGGFAVCRSIAKKYRFFGNEAVFGQQYGQQGQGIARGGEGARRGRSVCHKYSLLAKLPNLRVKKSRRSGPAYLFRSMSIWLRMRFSSSWPVQVRNWSRQQRARL